MPTMNQVNSSASLKTQSIVTSLGKPSLAFLNTTNPQHQAESAHPVQPSRNTLRDEIQIFLAFQAPSRDAPQRRSGRNTKDAFLFPKWSLCPKKHERAGQVEGTRNYDYERRWVRKARKRNRTQSKERKGGAEREGGALGGWVS